MAKTINIAEDMHAELKFYSAVKSKKMESVATLAIKTYLQSQGHKFSQKSKIIK